MAVLADPAITERQKRVLIDVYTSFVKENEKSSRRPPRPPTDHITPYPITTRRRQCLSKQTPDAGQEVGAGVGLHPAVRGRRPDRRPGRRAQAARWPRPRRRASKRVDELQSKRPSWSKQAKDSADELRTFVITLPEQFKNLPEATKARIAELQKQANELIVHATSTYGELAGRGKRGGRRGASARPRTSPSKAEKRADETRADVVERVDPAFETVQERRDRGPPDGHRPRPPPRPVTPRSAAKASATPQGRRQEGPGGEDGSGQQGGRAAARHDPARAIWGLDVPTWCGHAPHMLGGVSRRCGASANRAVRGDRVQPRSWPGIGSGPARCRTARPCGSVRPRG